MQCALRIFHLEDKFRHKDYRFFALKTRDVILPRYWTNFTDRVHVLAPSGMLSSRMRFKFSGQPYAFCLFVIVLALTAAAACFAQDAVPTEILQRTFYIRCVSEAGTAFSVDRQGKMYLVTARHVVAGVPTNGATIQVRIGSEWKDYKIPKIIFPKSDNVDIAVMETNETLAKPYTVTVPAGNEGPTFGQTVWFLGYPLADGLSSHAQNLSFPFIKRGAISAIDATNPDAVIFYIDGINNHGFSGGPVVYWDFKAQAYRILAVVQGFRTEPADAVVNGAAVQSNILLNSGILTSYSIKHAVDAIDAETKAAAE